MQLGLKLFSYLHCSKQNLTPHMSVMYGPGEERKCFLDATVASVMYPAFEWKFCKFPSPDGYSNPLLLHSF